jgi:hypothetical protein
MGCVHIIDDTLVPDDGIACTRDSCSNGVAVHTADDSLCDDGLYCDGMEVCSPGNPMANTRGCITINVPVAPAPLGCISYGACSEALRGFVPIQQPAGSACNDGIACTLNDSCSAGGDCAGTPTAACSSTTCVPGGHLPATVDIPLCDVSVSVTLGGQPLPMTGVYGLQTTLYLRAVDTGALHMLSYFDYTGVNSTLYGPISTTKVVPGVYDLVYWRDWDPKSNQVTETVGDAIPHGMRVLQSALVLGLGSHALAVDIPVAMVAGTVTLGGQPLPPTGVYGLQTSIYLRSQDTGALHLYAYFDYTGVNSTLYGPVFADKMVPGTYDVLYWRDWDPTSNQVTETNAGDAIPHGLRVLASGVVLAPGANTLNVDIPVAAVGGTITLGGQPLPATGVYGLQTSIYLKSQDTGALHLYAYFDYTGVNSTLYGPVSTTKVIPGTYDVLYWRDWDPTSNQVTETAAGDAIPHGLRVLTSGVVLAPGANTLNVDIPVATVSGTITLGGQPLPATGVYGLQTALYLKSRDTGALHLYAYFDYTGVNSTLYGPVFSTMMVPGTYDVLYWRDWDPTSNQVTETTAGDPIPHGLRVLTSGVVLAPGANVVDVDIPVAQIGGTITLGGAALPPTGVYGLQTTLYLKSQDTGALHLYAYFDYTGVNSTLYGPIFTTSVIPGTYDVLYWRDWDPTSNQVTETTSTDPIPHGLRLLQTGVVVPAGQNTLNIDIPIAPIAANITLAGQPLPTTGVYGLQTTLYLKSRDTGALHLYGYFDYTGVNSTLYGPIVTSKVLPGTYDILYWRDWDPTSNQVTETDSGDAIPHGLRLLGACVTVP